MINMRSSIIILCYNIQITGGAIVVGEALGVVERKEILYFITVTVEVETQPRLMALTLRTSILRYQMRMHCFIVNMDLAGLVVKDKANKDTSRSMYRLGTPGIIGETIVSIAYFTNKTLNLSWSKKYLSKEGITAE
mmetsp:Transcript_1153/g.2338  ORF Transcript_1153/g.2338 Transcript_1153/m.2338 type:complete len:136 (+) Transcript_1153:2689-3096(+)